MGGSFGVRCKLSASQGAALHPVAFEKTGAKLYYGVVMSMVDSFIISSAPVD